MRTITALLMLVAASGCHFDFTGDANAELGGDQNDDSTDWDMRTPANDDGCYPDTLAAEHALCVCEDLDEVGRLRLLEGESARPASLGVNGTADLITDMYVEGSAHVQGGIDAVSEIAIRESLLTAGSFDWVGSQEIAGDLVVGGHLTGVGDLAVAGTFRLGGDLFMVGDLDAPRRGAYTELADPCVCRGDGYYFDVATAVADASVVNDNASIELDATLEGLGDTELVLPSGRYYFESWDLVGDAHILAEGHVAIFVDGGIEQVGDGQLSVSEEGSLDLYVAGGVTTVGELGLGGSDPALFRLFIGGDDPVLLSVGEQRITGHVYAPRAKVELVGETEIVGSLFARSLDGVGELTIRYAGGAQTHEATCEEIPPDLY